MNQLRERKYYEDLYDLLTIEECIRFDLFSTDRASRLKDKEKRTWSVVLNDLMLYHAKGGRYERREETLREWMENDIAKDEYFENSKPPENALICPKCDSENLRNFLKDLQDRNEKLRVLYFFECNSCGERYGCYDDGKKYERTKPLCKKCGRVAVSKDDRKGDIITTTLSCNDCNHIETRILNLSVNDPERKEKNDVDRKLLNKYRGEFCMSEKEGREYLESKVNTERLSKLMKDQDKKNGDPRYKKAKKLKILKIQQLKKLLHKRIVKDGYVNLIFEKADMGRFVALPFQIEDGNDDRGEYDSKNGLKKSIQACLKPTNWRLMSDGIHCRLGILSGRLRAYEGEEDLIRIV